MAHAPSPRQNFIQALLFASVIFLGIQLFTGRKPPTPYDTQSVPQVMQALLNANAELKDQTAHMTIYPKLQERINAAVQEKKITEDDAQKFRIQGAIIVADTQYKAGLARNDINRMRAGYATLVHYHNQLMGKPEWQTMVDVPDTRNDERFGWNQWSGELLYNKIVDTVSQRNKSELIWGFLPGGYALIDMLVKATGSAPAYSYAFAAFLLALVVRAAVYPLAQKQLMWGRQMSQLAPLTSELREQYKDDPQTLNLKVMEIYREYGINPLAGCGPMFIQLPLFFTVYQCMILYQFEFQKGHFLWINPGSHQANAFFAPNLGQLDTLLIIIYGISMLATTLLSPVSDPSQAKQQRMIGVGFAIFATLILFTGSFPVAGAFVLYWTFTNILATAQSLRAYRLPMPPLEKVNAPGGGVFPLDPNGKARPGSISKTGPVKTGTPAKHKPKKRK